MTKRVNNSQAPPKIFPTNHGGVNCVAINLGVVGGGPGHKHEHGQGQEDQEGEHLPHKDPAHAVDVLLGIK